MAFLDSVFNPILQPLVDLSPFWAVFLISLVISLLITLAYKYFTDQNEMKRLKGLQKDFQKQMKELREHPEEMMKVQKEAMKTNMEYMKHSFKVTLITILPIILIFGWMNAHLMYEPIFPGERFSITAEFAEEVNGQAELLPDEGVELISEAQQKIDGEVVWNLKSTAGMHLLTVKTDTDEQTKKVLITKELAYEEAISNYEHSDISSIKINYNKLRPLGDLSLFGWQPGWLGLYIIFSIVFSILLRKLMKIY
jgi:uncharacterized membrane protein (DUF106 family)